MLLRSGALPFVIALLLVGFFKLIVINYMNLDFFEFNRLFMLFVLDA